MIARSNSVRCNLFRLFIKKAAPKIFSADNWFYRKVARFPPGLRNVR